MTTTNVCIIGAGPAGCAAALKLSYLGISCVLVDKCTFPRDKICGDAISGKVPLMLNRLDPQIFDRFLKEVSYSPIWGLRLGAPNGSIYDVPFKPRYDKNKDISSGFVSTRMSFDNFLVNEVKRRKSISLYEGIQVSSFEKTNNGYVVNSKDNSFECTCTLLMDASGAQSSFSRKHAGLNKINHHYAGAVRAYYENVNFPDSKDFIELHFLEEYLPGYFWIFPLPNNMANVGIGVRTDVINKKEINLKKSLELIINEHPYFKDRFMHARLKGKVQGYGLPLGSKKRKLSGDHYMLLGDAAHLIDPATGEGIGNGIYSGIYAAEQADKCFQGKIFSGTFLKEYDKIIHRVLGSEMKFSYRMQWILSSKRLTNMIANILVKNKKSVSVISRMYTDMDYRKQLLNPLFWWSLKFAKK